MPDSTAQPDAARGAPTAPRRALWLAAPFLALALLTKLPSLGFEHREPDELIYWTLAHHLDTHGTYTLRGLNRRTVPGVDCHFADLGDLEGIRPAFEGIETVVHLAAAAGDNNAPADIMRSNVVGTHNAFEAARLAGVGRVIFASSGATVAGWEREPPLSHIVAGEYDKVGDWSRLTHESPTRPGGAVPEGGPTTHGQGDEMTASSSARRRNRPRHWAQRAFLPRRRSSTR